ncbi:mucin-associated surface protein (MASP) [Trypanosoma cruzi]|nr:mucin-associated surface protein (MASP) [Trypanosoma cruzi]
MSCGAHVWRKLRERRTGLLGEEGKAPPTQKKLIVIRRARACLSRSGHESHRACARCRHSGTDVRVNSRNRVLAKPIDACHAVCAPSLSSLDILPVPSPDRSEGKSMCQALTQSCGRDRASTASASAVTLRGIPQCHGENVEPTVRPQSASESGTV